MQLLEAGSRIDRPLVTYKATSLLSAAVDRSSLVLHTLDPELAIQGPWLVLLSDWIEGFIARNTPLSRGGDS